MNQVKNDQVRQNVRSRYKEIVLKMRVRVVHRLQAAAGRHLTFPRSWATHPKNWPLFPTVRILDLAAAIRKPSRS